MRLHDIIEGWGAGQPDNLSSLLEHPYEDLDDKARSLRSMAVDLVHSFERSPVNTARDALTLIEKHHLPVRKGLWSIVALNAARERVYVRSARGMRLLHTVSRSVPRKSDLLENVPLPDAGKYLAIYGGGSSTPSASDSERLRELADAGLLVDVLFWDVASSPASFYSARAQVESCGAVEAKPTPIERWDLW